MGQKVGWVVSDKDSFLMKSCPSSSIGRGQANTLHNSRGRQHIGFHVDKALWTGTEVLFMQEVRGRVSPGVGQHGSAQRELHLYPLKPEPPEFSSPIGTC